MHLETPINALIVDDEDLAREKTRHFLSEAPDWRVMAECANGFQAVRESVFATLGLLLPPAEDE
jgi:DNA-binding NarL/FixJ family response regulator